ncbi:MAG: zinc ribbon domain-containing protein [Anaerolineae bacterium]|nr:zinc ribbon domain-containing protein [Anaerolineae bacterium]
MMCPKCHQIVPDGTKFCPYDGTPIGRVCPKYKTNNMPSAQFCTNCGTQL